MAAIEPARGPMRRTRFRPWFPTGNAGDSAEPRDERPSLQSPRCASRKCWHVLLLGKSNQFRIYPQKYASNWATVRSAPEGESHGDASAHAIRDCLRRFVEIFGCKACSGLVASHELGSLLRRYHVLDILERAAAALVHHV